MSATFSPDGRHVAYTRTDSSGNHRVRRALSQPVQSECLPPNLADSPKHPRWSPDGKRIYYDPRPGDFESVEVLLEPEVRFGKRQPVPYHPFRLAPPGIAHAVRHQQGRPFRGSDSGGSGRVSGSSLPRTIVVIRNWFETLKQKVGWTWFDTFKSYFW